MGLTEQKIKELEKLSRFAARVFPIKGDDDSMSERLPMLDVIESGIAIVKQEGDEALERFYDIIKDVEREGNTKEVVVALAARLICQNEGFIDAETAIETIRHNMPQMQVGSRVKSAKGEQREITGPRGIVS